MVASIANFIEHRLANPESNLYFRFITNAEVGREKLSPMPKEEPALLCWERLRRGNISAGDKASVLKGLRILLTSAVRPKGLGDRTWDGFQSFLNEAHVDTFRQVVERFEVAAVEAFLDQKQV